MIIMAEAWGDAASPPGLVLVAGGVWEGALFLTQTPEGSVLPTFLQVPSDVPEGHCPQNV